MKTVGVIGTAKNTGKTTTLSFLLRGFLARGSRVGITGIGYDGEDIDNITNLPKPRLYLEKGSIAATSEKCLRTAEAKYETIADTALQTALGSISLVRITKPGVMVIAGPNTKSGLAEILRHFKEVTPCNAVLIDGSLNRISPMSIADKLVFTTGASRDTHIENLVSEMSLVERVFRLRRNTGVRGAGTNVRVIDTDGDREICTQSLVDEDDFRLLFDAVNANTVKVYIPGLFSPALLAKKIALVSRRVTRPLECVFHSPVQLLFDTSSLASLLRQFDDHSIKVSCALMPVLSAITVNPFFPNQENFSYSASYINKEMLLRRMSANLQTPVFNVLDAGAEGIYAFV